MDECVSIGMEPLGMYYDIEPGDKIVFYFEDLEYNSFEYMGFSIGNDGVLYFTICNVLSYLVFLNGELHCDAYRDW
jgi:hypothetical protein